MNFMAECEAKAAKGCCVCEKFYKRPEWWLDGHIKTLEQKGFDRGFSQFSVRLNWRVDGGSLQLGSHWNLESKAPEKTGTGQFARKAMGAQDQFMEETMMNFMAECEAKAAKGCCVCEKFYKRPEWWLDGHIKTLEQKGFDRGFSQFSVRLNWRVDGGSLQLGSHWNLESKAPEKTGTGQFARKAMGAQDQFMEETMMNFMAECEAKAAKGCCVCEKFYKRPEWWLDGHIKTLEQKGFDRGFSQFSVRLNWRVDGGSLQLGSHWNLESKAPEKTGTGQFARKAMGAQDQFMEETMMNFMAECEAKAAKGCCVCEKFYKRPEWWLDGHIKTLEQKGFDRGFSQFSVRLNWRVDGGSLQLGSHWNLESKAPEKTGTGQFARKAMGAQDQFMEETMMNFMAECEAKAAKGCCVCEKFYKRPEWWLDGHIKTLEQKGFDRGFSQFSVRLNWRVDGGSLQLGSHWNLESKAPEKTGTGQFARKAMGAQDQFMEETMMNFMAECEAKAAKGCCVCEKFYKRPEWWLDGHIKTLEQKGFDRGFSQFSVRLNWRVDGGSLQLGSHWNLESKAPEKTGTGQFARKAMGAQDQFMEETMMNFMAECEAKAAKGCCVCEKFYKRPEWWLDGHIKTLEQKGFDRGFSQFSVRLNWRVDGGSLQLGSHWKLDCK